MKTLGQALQDLAEAPHLHNQDLVGRKVTQFLCNFWSKRRGFIQGVPYGLPCITNGDMSASILEEMARFSRDRRGSGSHYARVFLSKLGRRQGEAARA